MSTWFRSYHVTKKNHQVRSGGGITILVHKLLQFSIFNIVALDTSEAVSAAIMSSDSGPFD